MTDAIAPIIGVSPAVRNAVALIERFAQTILPILLVGATGTGKELFARHIHLRSHRRGTLVDVNCGALPEGIAESLLFGHRRGAFTGAVESVAGHLERADNGTLFLDEVLHLTPPAQVMLLRALEAGEVQPVGACYKRHVDFRVVSAAQEDAPDRLERGLFRRDLFQRLAGIVIELPTLSDRPEDIVPLAEYFATAQGQVLEPDTRIVLEAHEWPGNVRELRLTMERAGCLVNNGTIPPSAVRDAIALGIPRPKTRSDCKVSAREMMAERGKHISRQRERVELLAQCEAHGWNAARLAESQGVPRSTLYDRLKAAGISLRKFRKSGNPEFRNSTGIPENRPSLSS